ERVVETEQSRRGAQRVGQRGVRAKLGLAAAATGDERGRNGADRALVRPENPGRAQEQCALAGAGGAGDAHALTGGDSQGDPVERGDFTGATGDAGAIAAGDAAEFERERGHAAMCTRRRRGVSPSFCARWRKRAEWERNSNPAARDEWKDSTRCGIRKRNA